MQPAYRDAARPQTRIQIQMSAFATRAVAGLRAAAILLLLFTAHCEARASIAFLMEEPYGAFGAVNPTGHAAVYLSHICANSPTSLRPCHEGEYGVVISRYHKIGGFDWLAVPLVPYLYAVNNPSDSPVFVDRETAAALRDAYRRAHLLALAPDNSTGDAPGGEWTQLIGASFDRTIHGFQIDTSPEQDARFIALFNDRRNVSHFNLFFHNCADFSRVVLDTYMPGAVHRNFIADAGLMTPKQVARSLLAYSRRHPEIHMTAFVIPQVKGTIPRSHSVDGVAESLFKSKKYIIPLAVLSPGVTGGVVAAYLVDGRLKLPRGTPIFNIAADETLPPALEAAPASAAPVPRSASPTAAKP